MASSLLAIAMQILAKFVGYDFVCKVLIRFLELWAKSTKTDFDEKVFLVIADALGVPSAELKKLVEQAEQKPLV